MLYDNEFKKFDIVLEYIPHMKISKLPTAELLDDAYYNIKSVNDTFSTIVKKVSVSGYLYLIFYKKLSTVMSNLHGY